MATQAGFVSFNVFFLNLKSETVETLFQDMEIKRWILDNKKHLEQAVYLE